MTALTTQERQLAALYYDGGLCSTINLIREALQDIYYFDTYAAAISVINKLELMDEKDFAAIFDGEGLCYAE